MLKSLSTIAVNAASSAKKIASEKMTIINEKIDVGLKKINDSLSKVSDMSKMPHPASLGACYSTADYNPAIIHPGSLHVPETAVEMLSIRCVSWNMGNNPPPPTAELASLVTGTESKQQSLPQMSLKEACLSLPALVVISVQECAYQPREGYKDVAEDFLQCMSEAMEYVGAKHYRLVRAEQLGAIQVLVFAYRELWSFISKVQSATVATGLAGTWGNKGGVVVAFDIWNSSLCFIGAHLAAHVDQTVRRNQDARDILLGLRLSLSSVGRPEIDLHHQAHHTFVLGDLNYRLRFGATEEEAMMRIPPDPVFEEVCRQIKLGDAGYAALLKNDQLNVVRSKGLAYHGYQEGDISFPPTYRMAKSGSDYDRKRLPAWCDRILWRSIDGFDPRVIQTLYSSLPNRTSDHKPVFATFLLKPLVHGPCWIKSSPPPAAFMDILGLGFGEPAASPVAAPKTFTQLVVSDLSAVYTEGALNTAAVDGVVFQTYILLTSTFALRNPAFGAKTGTMAGQKPTWKDEKKLPLPLNSAEELASCHLFIRVATENGILACGAVSLGPAVLAAKNKAAAPFQTIITKGGLVLGAVKGNLRLA